MLAPAWLIFTLKASPDEPNKDSLSWDPDAIRRGDAVGTGTERTGMALIVVEDSGIVDALGIVEVWDPLLTREDTVWDTRGPIWARI